MTVKVSRAQRAAARRLIEIAEAEGQPVDERLEAIANAELAKQPDERPWGIQRADLTAKIHNLERLLRYGGLSLEEYEQKAVEDETKSRPS